MRSRQFALVLALPLAAATPAAAATAPAARALLPGVIHCAGNFCLFEDGEGGRRGS